MSPRLRWALWATLLAAAAVLVIGDRRERAAGSIVEAVPRVPAPGAPAQRPAARTAESKEVPMIDAIRPRPALTEVGNAFAARDWTPPAPPPPPPRIEAPVRPTAPPLPYKVLGKKLEDGQWQVFLTDGSMVHVVRAQDVLDGRYRVVEIRPPTMTLLYTPLNERQALQIGGTE
jgi:hypothetical protein